MADFNISPKQDDPQRLIELNGVPQKFWLSAEEINSMIKHLSALLGQETALYKGEFPNLEALEEAHPLPEPGSEAQLTVVDGDNLKASWDNTNKKWFQDGVYVQPGSSAAYLLKSVYDADGDGIIDKVKDIHAVLTAGGTKYYGTKNGVVGVFDLPTGTGGTSTPTEFISLTPNWQSGLTYKPLAKWKYNGTLLTSNNEVTADPADPTLPRYDLFIINLFTAQVEIIKGIASENRTRPGLTDPANQLDTGIFISIAAGAATPENVNAITIFAEGADGEWAVNVGPSYDPASPNSPASGLICLETVLPVQEGNAPQFIAPAPVPVMEGMELQYKIKNKAGGAHRFLIMGNKSNGGSTSYWMDMPGTYSPTSTDYQKLSLTLPSTNMAEITQIRPVSGFDGFDYHMDDVRLVTGSGGVTGDFATEDFVIQKVAEGVAESKAYTDSLVIGGGDNVHNSYDTMAAMIADQGNQIDGEYFVVVDASGHSTVNAGWAFFEYLGTTLGTDDDYRKLSEEESLDLVSSEGSANTAPGAFSGVLDVSGGNKYYDDYTEGPVVDLSLSEIKALGATATVRIKGDLTGTKPAEWNFSGQPISSSSSELNELTLLYVRENDVRIVNRLFPHISNSIFIDWEQEVGTVDEGSGTLGRAADADTVGGFTLGAYAAKAITGDNAVSFSIPAGNSVAALGLTATYRDIATNQLSTADTLILMNATNGALNVNEDGAQVYASTDWADGAIGTMRLTETTLSFELNGTTVFTSSKVYDMPLTPVGLIHTDRLETKILGCEYDNLTNTETSTL